MTEITQKPLSLDHFGQKPVGIGESAFMLLVIFLASQCFVEFLYRDDGVLRLGRDGGIVIQVIWSAIYFITFFLLVLRFGFSLLVNIIWKVRYPFILAVMAIASVYWSVSPVNTLNRAISLWGTILVGVYFGARFSPVEQLRIIRWFFISLIGLSVFTALVFPSYGTMRFVSEGFINPDAWKGITSHKNLLGPLATLGMGYFAIELLLRRAGRIKNFVLLVLSIIVVVMSKSSTGIILMGVVFAAIMITLASRTYRLNTPLIMATVVSIFAYLVFIFFGGWDLILGILGRSATLTGRVLIWRDAFFMIEAKPFLGFGFKAIWGMGDESRLPQFFSTIWAPHAHNGYLSTSADLGLVALTVAVFYLIRNLYMSLDYLSKSFTVHSMFCVVVFLRVFFFNLVETSINTQQNIEWMLVVSLSTSLFFWANRSGPALHQPINSIS